MLKAIIFDLDETLLDWGDRAISWEEHYRKHLDQVYDYVTENISPLPNRKLLYDSTFNLVKQQWEDARETLKAPHFGKILIDVCIHLGVSPSRLDAEALMRAYGSELVGGVRLFPEVLTELERLQSYGLRFGIATNAMHPMSMRDAELEEVDLLRFFDKSTRVSAADAGFLKPHPYIFQVVLEGLATTIEETVFVGDSRPADIAGAKAMGMKAILRQRNDPLPYQTDEEGGKDAHPDAIIESLTELYPIFDDWFPEWRH